EPNEDRAKRHKSSQTFNRYRTIDRPAHDSTVSPLQIGTPPHRPRYSIKERTRSKQHEPLPPQTFKQYKWKPWKEVPESPAECDTGAPKESENKSDKKKNPEKEPPKKKKSPGKKEEPTAAPKRDTEKVDLVRGLQKEHPT
ncbi:hypothetical protein BGX26_008921, partial [Mortierella sp. AD094]